MNRSVLDQITPTVSAHRMPPMATVNAPAAETNPQRTLAWPYAICGLVVLVVFTADWLLPRGVTAAIGYSLVPVIAAITTRRRFVLSMTILCTILIPVGYLTEAPGAPWYTSFFDRVMVAGVLWLTCLLVLRRVKLLRALIDRTEALAATTKELNRSNAELERFASLVSHDLRAPLNTIGLYVQSLATSAAVQQDPVCLETISDVQEELSRTSGFMQSLLAYGRAGARDLHLADCDMTSLLDQVKQRLRGDIDRYGARITNDPLPTVRADPVLLGQLLQNLIENSLKYRRDGEPPTIHLSAALQDGHWLFSLRDNGIGIPPGDLPHIFDTFHQGNHLFDSPQTGVGLGLATCQRIVHRHAGTIHAHSTPTQGTTFQFTLPNHAPEPAPLLPSTRSTNS